MPFLASFLEGGEMASCLPSSRPSGFLVPTFLASFLASFWPVFRPSCVNLPSVFLRFAGALPVRFLCLIFLFLGVFLAPFLPSFQPRFLRFLHLPSVLPGVLPAALGALPVLFLASLQAVFGLCGVLLGALPALFQVGFLLFSFFFRAPGGFS